MRSKLLSLFILILLAGSLLPAGLTRAPAAQATAYHAIAIDGDMGEWAIDEDMEADGPYTLYLTWDANSLYLGLTGATLGDTGGQDKSFFVCFDTDLTPGSGAGVDGYSTVTFDTATFAPEHCYYFAGGGGWYEWSTWNGSSWDYNGWRDDGTYYDWPSNPAPLPGSEMTITRTDILTPTQVGVVAWLTPEESGTVEASWPASNPVGSQPQLADAYVYVDLNYDGVSPDIAVGAQGDHVVINELDNYTEWLELYNPTDASVDIGGWLLTAQVDSLNYTIPAGTVLPSGGYWTYDTTYDMDNGGDVISLYDAGAALVDQVGYGNYGGAPAPSTVWRTVARVPNGTDTDDDAWDWNLTITPTQGMVNLVPPVDLGSSLILNEFDNYPAAGGDMVELYNPTGTPVSITGWYLSDGDAVADIVTTTAVPAYGWLALLEGQDWTVSMDFTSTDVGYLFLPDGTRVDQIGWAGEYEDGTFQRICDGEGPNVGYDWDSSGGGVTWFDLEPTLGSSNVTGPVDMVIDKTGPSIVPPGSTFDYVITYTVSRPIPATAFVITDILPLDVSYVTFTAEPALSLVGTAPLSWNGVGACGFPAGVITLTVDMSDTIPPGAILINTVEVTATGEFTPSDNIATFATTVAGAETALDKAGPDLILPGETIAYTLGYEVMGDPSEGVLITDTLPADVTYISDTAPVTPTEPVSGTLVWSMGTVTDSGSFVVYGLVSANPLTYTLHNEAWVYAINDTDPNNNHDFVDTALPMPIYEIQHVDVISGTSPSPYAGEHVYTLGVVNAVYPPSGSYQRFAIVDPSGNGPWQGLYVYGATSMIPTVEYGDMLVLGGTVAEYYGFTELGDIDYYELLTAGHPVPDPVLTTTAAISTVHPQTAEPLEGVLVEVHCAEVTRLASGYGEWGITDASGEEAQVDDTGDYTYVPVLGDVLTVRGVLFYSFDQFEIEPRGDGDILMTPLLTDHGPVDGDVPIGADIWATFNLTLSAATVNTATFFLDGPAGLVPGAVSYDGGTWTATLDPDADLAYDTTYTATLTTGIESLEGVALCADYLWTFTTEEEPGPDLRPSSKTADRGAVEPGSTLTYTILLNNTGELTASAVLTDVVPAEVTVLTPTLPPGMVYDGGLLLWSGEVYPGQPSIELPFQVEVGAGVPSGTTIVNEVWIDDGVHLFTRSVSVQVLTCVPVSNPAFTWLPADPVVGQVITFTGTADGWAPIAYTWSFGDGATGTGATVQHTYAMSDTYTVVMTATNACGELAISHMVVVVEEPQPAWKVYLPIVVRGWGQ